jgi:hypothetical protein
VFRPVASFHHLDDILIHGHNNSSIPTRTEILRRVKAESACRSITEPGSMSLSCVFDDNQTMSRSPTAQRTHIAHLAIEVDRYDSTSVWRNRTQQSVRIQSVKLGIYISEDRHATRLYNGDCRVTRG